MTSSNPPVIGVSLPNLQSPCSYQERSSLPSNVAGARFGAGCALGRALGANGCPELHRILRSFRILSKIVKHASRSLGSLRPNSRPTCCAKPGLPNPPLVLLLLRAILWQACPGSFGGSAEAEFRGGPTRKDPRLSRHTYVRIHLCCPDRQVDGKQVSAEHLIKTKDCLATMQETASATPEKKYVAPLQGMP